MIKDLKETIKTNSDQRENILKREIIKKETNRNYGVEQYNTWNEKFRRGVQQQTWARRKNQ